MASSAQIQALVTQFVTDLGLADQIIQGSPTTVVSTAGGPVKSFANAIKGLNLVGAVRFNTLLDLNANLTFDAGILAQVEGDAVTANNGVYLKSGPNPGGAWTKISDTAITALNALYANLVTKIAPDTTGLVNGVTAGTIFEDINGLVSAIIDSNLDWHIFSKLFTQGGESIGASTDPSAGFSVVDPNGKVYLRITADGKGDFIPGVTGGSTANTVKNALGADIVHIILRGQSLWQGADSVPAVSTPALGYGGLMFGGYGVRTWDFSAFPLNPELRPDAKFSLTALVESDNGQVGETVASGLVAMLQDMIFGHYKTGDRSAGQQILVTFPDQGGRLLDEISKVPVTPDGIGAYYATAIDDVKRAKAAAATLGKTYAVLLVDFGQGEANGIPQMVRGGPTLPWATFWPLYANQLLLLRSNMETDIQAITAQKGRIPLVSYETEGPVTSHAQLLASDIEPGLVQVVGPHYDIPTALNSHFGSPVLHGNEIHRSADGTRMMGCRHGKWIARQYLFGERIRPMRITGARYVGSNQILVDVDAPRPPVVIDTTWLPAQTASMGFNIASGIGETAVVDPLVGGSPCLVTKVAIAGPAQLLLTVATALPSSPHLHYARIATTDPVSAPLAAYQDGAGSIYGYATKELVFTGLLKASLQPLVDEGCFYANNTTAPRFLNRALIIRDVQEVSGQTKLIGQANELGAGAAFLPGDIICPMRGDPFGNIRDSDNEYCPLTFSDTNYGTRAGKQYPMWNWLSTDVDVEIKL